METNVAHHLTAVEESQPATDSSLTTVLCLLLKPDAVLSAQT